MTKRKSNRELLEQLVSNVSELMSDVSILKNDVSTLKDDVAILKREAAKHDWNLSSDSKN